MLHAAAHTPTAPSTMPPTTFLSMQSAEKPKKLPESLLEVTYSSVRMDASNLWREPGDAARGQIVEAIRLADLRDKSELLLINVMPWVKIERGEITDMPETQKKVEELLANACARLQRDVPEVRLSLRSGEIDIRCYLGREKPTDHVFADDWTSDSR